MSKKLRYYSSHKTKAGAREMLKMLKAETTMEITNHRIVKKGKYYDLRIATKRRGKNVW